MEPWEQEERWRLQDLGVDRLGTEAADYRYSLAQRSANDYSLRVQATLQLQAATSR